MSELTQEQGCCATIENSVEQQSSTYVPRFDLVETADHFILYGDLPGVKPEDVEVQFENDELRIHGKVAPRHESSKFLRHEYGLGDYDRKFSVGDAIDSSKITAELKHGVLTVQLPKREALKPKRVEVKVN
jgi:HSP20 family molecular chaperone IbpA